MSLSDPLGDMLARIKNGQLRKKESVLMPASRFRGNVLDVLHREGYIRGFKKVEIENNKNEFEIELKFRNPYLTAYGWKKIEYPKDLNKNEKKIV